MKTAQFRGRTLNANESGQAMTLTLMVLGLFLLGAIAFAVDMGNLWYHRQSAQNAADAACTAGAMDMLVAASGASTGKQGFVSGTSFDCKAHSAYIPCKYAALNGYDSKDTKPGNLVAVGFPGAGAVKGVPSGVVPDSATVPNAFMRVDVTDHVQTWFSALFSGKNTKDVRAMAVCGVVLASSPIPILVLDPRSSDSQTLLISGNPNIVISGGPTRSIQVNTANTDAVHANGVKAVFDLSQGGPNNTGSDLGTWGGPISALSQFKPGTTGHWIAPAAPISDPFAQTCAPGQSTSTCQPNISGNPAPGVPGAPTVPNDEKAARFPASPCTAIPCSVAYRDHGCPETTAVRGDGQCMLYTAGKYTSDPNPHGGGSHGITILLDPGLYYFTKGLTLGSNSTIRPGTGLGDGSGGVTIYFSGTNSISVAADSASKVKDPFNTMTGPHDRTGTKYPNDATHTNVTYTNGARCTATSTMPANLTGGKAGTGVDIGTDSSGNATGANLLLGACTGYYGDPIAATDPLGVQRNMLFFQDRSATSVNPNWGGGGQFLLAGTMYFHSCNPGGSGEGCTTTTPYYTDQLTLQGNSGSGTYILGDIVVDKLSLGGTSGLTMDLNPTKAFTILKATLLPWSDTN